MVVVQAVARFMQEYKEENWMLPVMYTACLDVRYVTQMMMRIFVFTIMKEILNLL